MFAREGIRYVAPLASLAEPAILAKQLFPALARFFPGLRLREVGAAVEQGYAALRDFDQSVRAESRAILDCCARSGTSCILVLARPYHLDPGIGHEIEAELQACGYPVLWGQYLPLDADLLDRLFGEEVRQGEIASASRYQRRVAVVLQRQHQRDSVGSQVRGQMPMDQLRHPPDEL